MRWNLAPGTRLNVQLTQTTRTQTAVKDAVTAVQIESGCDVQWAVDRVDAEGTMQLTQAFTRLWLKTVSPDGKSSVYDSALAQEPAAVATAIADAVRPLLRVRIGISLSRRGEILDVQRSAEMDSLLGNLPALTGWKALLTKEGMSRTLTQALGTLPEAPVKAGDQWTGTREIDTPLGKIVATDTYTYEGPARDLANGGRQPAGNATDTDTNEGPARDGDRVLDKIRVTTDLKPSAAADSPAAAASEKLPRQQLEGVYLFDAAAGLLAESRLTQTLLAEVPYAGGTIEVKTISTLAARLTRLTRQEPPPRPVNRALPGERPTRGCRCWAGHTWCSKAKIPHGWHGETTDEGQYTFPIRGIAVPSVGSMIAMNRTARKGLDFQAKDVMIEFSREPLRKD